MNKVLFVDDDVNILNGLKRMLRPLRNEIECQFFSEPKLALESMNSTNYDIIVSDMQMPVIDGAKFLKEAAEKQPKATRFVLSGHADDELIIKSISVSHQFMSKPCESEVIINKIRKTIQLRQNLQIDKYDDEILYCLENIKTLPATYSNVKESIESDEYTNKTLARLIYSDPLLTAQILKIVNSAYFGAPRNITDLEMAITYLGVNRLLSIILSLEYFTQSTNREDSKIFSKIFNHCLEIATFAREMSKDMGMNSDQQNEIFISGNLHDIGKIVFFNVYKHRYDKYLDNNYNLIAEEDKDFGINHTKVGAYLLGLWGFDEKITNSIIYHHDDKYFFDDTTINPAKILFLTHQIFNNSNSLPEDTIGYLNSIGIGHLVNKWVERYKELYEQ